eukprot:INCI11263.1.p1 GENE.INCI11263.1~~INCI11263.1.p1  ORF type:complete len:214 (-),score=36.54 INCI11263.1:316-957(-)
MAAPVIRFLLGAVTDFALVPSLYLIAKRRRHFEMFVGITQVVTAVLFNTCAAFNVDLFLRESEWHFISDVLSLSYVCCLLVHALALPSEDVNIILRYVAFALAWVFKVRDSWDEGWWEGLLVGTYAVAAVARVAKEPFVLIHFQIRNLIAGGVLLVLAVVCLVIELDGALDPYKLLAGVGHLVGGAAVFQLWQAVPVLSSKKEGAPPTDSSFV